MRRRWSKKVVLRHILTRYRRGQKLNSGYIQKREPQLYGAACAHFGEWKPAIEAAGLNYDEVRTLNLKKRRLYKVWGEKKVLAEIRKRKRNKFPLSSLAVQREDRKLYVAACRYYGGWGKAVSVAGFDYTKIRRNPEHRKWSKASIVAEIKRRVSEGLSIRNGDVRKSDQSLCVAANRYFGERGWSKARQAAGFSPTDPRPRKWNEHSVKVAILTLHRLGFRLDSVSLREAGYRYLRSAGMTVYGSWRKAIIAAGLDYTKIQRYSVPKGWWTRERILQTIKKLEREGVRLSLKTMRVTHPTIVRSAKKIFGGWDRAIHAAGFDYRRHVLKWSTKAWLRRLRQEEYKTILDRAQIHARTRRNSRRAK